MDDNVMACLNTMGLDIISHNNIFIPHAYQMMMMTENKNTNEMNVFADSLINLVLVRDNGQQLKYTFVRSIPDLEKADSWERTSLLRCKSCPEWYPPWF